jgi:hypothetical protein
VNLIFKRDDSTGQPMGSHTDSSRATYFQEIHFVGQGHDMGEIKRSRFFTPRPLKFRESAYKRREAGFMFLIVEPRYVPSPKVSLHRKVMEADTRAGLETHTPNNLVVSGTRLVLQEKVILEQMKLGGMPRNASQRWTKMAI